MKAFAELYSALDGTTRTTEKVASLREYFTRVSPAEAAWATYFLSGRKIKQVVPSRRLGEWMREATDLPVWLFQECYDAVGDIAETIALLSPTTASLTDAPLDACVESQVLALKPLDEDARKRSVLAAWATMAPREIMVFNKLLTGGFRVGVSQQLVTRGIAEAVGLEPGTIAQRLMGDWQPTAEFFTRLTGDGSGAIDAGHPYPFYLAHPLEADPSSLGSVSDWQAEWKWDGIRAQAIRRQGTWFVWTRGEELVTPRYPELHVVSDRLPDGTVLDGELLPARDGKPLPFGLLQKRIGRKTLSKKLLEEVPVTLMAYDLLEADGIDLRGSPLRERRQRLEAIVSAVNLPQLTISPIVSADSWAALAEQRVESRERGVEGLMLKRQSSVYKIGRVRGDWWKWKIEPLSIDAVLIYAQRGSGKRASLYTDYTFGVWDGDKLVPIAKAYSGLTDAEIRSVDTFIRKNTAEKFGPVRTVKPELVFELAFEGIQHSTRHKAGLALRFPRMARWRTDKKITDADTLETLRKLLASRESA